MGKTTWSTVKITQRAKDKLPDVKEKMLKNSTLKEKAFIEDMGDGSLISRIIFVYLDIEGV